jgi:hypothetical protein
VQRAGEESSDAYDSDSSDSGDSSDSDSGCAAPGGIARRGGYAQAVPRTATLDSWVRRVETDSSDSDSASTSDSDSDIDCDQVGSSEQRRKRAAPGGENPANSKVARRGLEDDTGPTYFFSAFRKQPWVSVVRFIPTGPATAVALETGEYRWTAAVHPPAPEGGTTGFDYGSRPTVAWTFNNADVCETVNSMASRVADVSRDAFSRALNAPIRDVPDDLLCAPFSILSGMSFMPWRRMVPFFCAIGRGEIPRSRYAQFFEARSFCGCPTKVISKAVTRGFMRTGHVKHKNVSASAVLPFSRGQPVVTQEFMHALSFGFAIETHSMYQLAASVSGSHGNRLLPCTGLALSTRVDARTLHMTICARPDMHVGTIIRRMRTATYATWSDEHLTQQFITMRTSTLCPSSAVRELAGLILAHVAVIMSPLVEVHHAYAPCEVIKCARCGVAPPVTTRDLRGVPACSDEAISAIYEGVRAHPHLPRSFMRALSPLFAADEAPRIDCPPACPAKRYAIACLWAIICDLSLVALIHAQHPKDARDASLPKVESMARAFTIFALKLAGTRKVESFNDNTIHEVVNVALAGIMECATAIAVANVDRLRVFQDGATGVSAANFTTLKVNTRTQQQRRTREGDSGQRQIRMCILRGPSGAADDWIGATSESMHR